MATGIAREWFGIQKFPAPTQTKLLEYLGKLKQENVDTLTILVMGKGGVGKSSTVNSILGERVATVNAFQSEGLRPMMISRSRAGFTLNIIDTPGLVEGGYVNEQALEIIKKFLLNKTIDVLMYVDRLDSYRVDNLDRQVIKAITDSFGKAIWKRGLQSRCLVKGVIPRQIKAEKAVSLIRRAVEELITKCKEIVEAEGEKIDEEDYVNETDPSILRFLLASREENLICSCLDETLVKQGVDQINLPTVGGERRQSPTTVEKICVILEGLLGYQCSEVWEMSFHILSAMFKNLGQSSSQLMAGAIRNLADMQKLPDEVLVPRKQAWFKTKRQKKREMHFTKNM